MTDVQAEPTEAVPLSEARCPMSGSILDPAVQNAPWALYAEAHESCPVVPIPELDAVMVTRYDDLRYVLTHPELFSNAGRGRGSGLQVELARRYRDIISERGWAHVETLQRTDPPVHTRYRRLLSKVFTPRRIQTLKPRIDEIACDLVDDMVAAGECDFVERFAMPMPGIMIAEQLGLDPTEIGRFRRWADAMLALTMRPVTEGEMLEAAETELDAQHHLAAEFEARRAEPRDDIMSDLVHAHDGTDDEPLSMHELQNLMHQLVTGGFETTTTAINHGLLRLVDDPDLDARLRADLSLIPRFCEEVIRYEGPVQGLARRATRDVELGGVTIPKDTTVFVRYGAANRDASVFPDPDVFDIDRHADTQHLAFGTGPHFCVGAALARQELHSSFEALLTRTSAIELAAPLPEPLHAPSLFLLPIEEIRVRLTGLS